MKTILFTVLLFILIPGQIFSQQDDLEKKLESLSHYNENLNHKIDRLEKLIDDVLWYNKIGDIAHVDKLYIYGPPKWKEKNPTAKGAGNPVKFWTYVFIPKDINHDIRKLLKKAGFSSE